MTAPRVPEQNPPNPSPDEAARRARMRARARRRVRERGVALIMVLGAMSVLTVMLAESQDDASAELASARADRDSVQAEYMARSAVNLSRLLIASEPVLRQSVAPIFALMRRKPPQLPVWQFSDRILGAFNDEVGAEQFSSTTGLDLSQGKNLGMPGGHFEVSIIDEDAKINVNSGGSNDMSHLRLAKELMGLMGPPQFNPLFEQRDERGNFHDRMQICQAIIDWADTDERAFSCDVFQNAPPVGGVEDGTWYSLLPKPYRPKNAPFDSLNELHMIRGVGEDFWATFVDPDPENPRKRPITVWGQGKVNVNSASPQALLGLVCAGAPQSDFCTDPGQSQAFLMGVTMAQGMSMGVPLFGSAEDFAQTMEGKGMLGPMLTAMGIKPVRFLARPEFLKSITTESKVFSVYAIGVVKGYKREVRTSVHAVVDFRGAPNLTALGGMPPGGALQPGQGGFSPSTPATPGTPQALPAGAGPDAIAAALTPSTGGAIVYYRIE
jgi:general secretion pathway protein K